MELEWPIQNMYAMLFVVFFIFTVYNNSDMIYKVVLKRLTNEEFFCFGAVNYNLLQCFHFKELLWKLYIGLVRQDLKFSLPRDETTVSTKFSVTIETAEKL